MHAMTRFSVHTSARGSLSPLRLPACRGGGGRDGGRAVAGPYLCSGGDIIGFEGAAGAFHFKREGEGKAEERARKFGGVEVDT